LGLASNGKLLAKQIACKTANRDTFLLSLRLEHPGHIVLNLNLIVTHLELCNHIYGAKRIGVVCCIVSVPELCRLLVTCEFLWNWINAFRL
jgi:hypothetical protein